MCRQSSFPPDLFIIVLNYDVYIRVFFFFLSSNDFSFVSVHLPFLLFFHESRVINLNHSGNEKPQLESQCMQVCVTLAFHFYCQTQLLTQRAIHCNLAKYFFFCYFKRISDNLSLLLTFCSFLKLKDFLLCSLNPQCL